MTREEANRKLADWIGWRFGDRGDIAPEYPENFEQTWWFNGLPYAESELPDFYESEAACAMLLEKLPEVMLYRVRDGIGNSVLCVVQSIPIRSTPHSMVLYHIHVKRPLQTPRSPTSRLRKRQKGNIEK